MGSDHEQASCNYAANLDSIQQAHARIRHHAHITPVLTCATIDGIAGRSLFFKCEQFQKGGAFKFRGAYNAVSSLSESEAAAGVITHSSGNHAGALALAASIRGIAAHIILPRNTPQCKVDAVRSYQADVTVCEPTMDAREAECSRVQAETGALLIHPYNDSRIISGQGTVAIEMLDQVPELDAIIVPVSGGGLISGISIAAKALNPNITIIAAEPEGTNSAADAAASKAAGHVVALPKPVTIADGLQGRLGDLTWPPIRDLVSGVVTITDQEIVAAMKLLYERMKVIVEPSGAAALAAALSPKFGMEEQWKTLQRIGIIITGGNLDLAANGFWDLWRV